VLAACGGGSAGSGGAGGAPTTGNGSSSGSAGSTSSSGAGGGTCNAVANVGTAVSETTDPGPTPTMTGGTIADGTYVLASAVYYAGSTAGSKTHKRTFQVAGTTIQAVNS